MGVILDSSVVIASERGSFALLSFLTALNDQVVGVAAITASELLHGVERAGTPESRVRRSSFVEKILAEIPVLPFGLPEARQHAVVWAALISKGESVGAHDLFIAATALAADFDVATLNRKEFERIPGLRLREIDAYRPSR